MKKNTRICLFLSLMAALWTACERDPIVVSGTTDNHPFFIKMYGGFGNEEGFDATEMPDGGFVLVGSTSSYSQGATDSYVVRTDAFGNIVWSHAFGGGFIDKAVAVEKIGDDFIVAGDSTTLPFEQIVYLKKYNKQGRELWTKRILSKQKDKTILEVKDLIVTSSNRIVIVGNEITKDTTRIFISIAQNDENNTLLDYQTYAYDYTNTRIQAVAALENAANQIVVLATANGNEMVLIELNNTAGLNKVNFFAAGYKANSFFQDNTQTYHLLGTATNNRNMVVVKVNPALVQDNTRFLQNDTLYGNSPIGASIASDSKQNILLGYTYRQSKENQDTLYNIKIVTYPIQTNLTKETYSTGFTSEKLKAGGYDKYPTLHTAKVFPTSDGAIALIGTNEIYGHNQILLFKINSDGGF